MVRVALCATLALLSGISEIDRLVMELGSDDPGMRDRAVSELVRKGREARPALESARRSPDLEVRERARFILGRISPLQVLFDFDPAKADANGPLNLSVRLDNESQEEAVFFLGGFSSRIVLRDVFEEPREGNVVFGGRSFRRAGCLLSEDDFVRVPPGCAFLQQSTPVRGREIDVEPEVRKRFPGIRFWAADTPGIYEVVASYRYDRPAYKARCTRGCGDHDDPGKAWNRCTSRSLDNNRSFTIAVGVERCVCDRH